MGNWQQWMEDGESSGHRPRKINKHVFCKKNKLGGGRFGQHTYDGNGTVCKLCGHIKKTNKDVINIEGETINE